MTGGDVGHAEFAELAAGYALHALDPADERRFLQHAAGCPDCLAQIARFAEVAAALAETAPAAEPGGDLGERILAATRPSPAGTGTQERAAGDNTPGASGRADPGPEDTGPAPAAEPTPVVPLRPRQRWLRRGAVAAAAALVAAGGIWGGLAATSGGTQPPLAMCAPPHACTEVPLVSPASHRVAAKVIVQGHEVWMLNIGMTANPRNDIYVLWQITGSHTPLAVGSFNIRTGSHAPIRIGGLAALPSPGSTAFAVSLEHGRTIPAAPSNKLALGRVS